MAILHPGDVIPGRALPLLGERGDHRVGSPGTGRSQVVVVTHQLPCDPCADYVRSWTPARDRLEDERAELVTVVQSGSQGSLDDAHGRVLVDDGTIGSFLSPSGLPAVAVVDRFGQLFACFEAGVSHQFVDHERVLNHLLDIAIRCPECGVPDVPGMNELPELDTWSGGMRLGDG